MLEIRELTAEDLNRELFRDFIRTQAVNRCWRKENGHWVIKDISCVDDWGESEYEELIRCLTNTIKTSGMVAGAFLNGSLKGFVSVEKEPIGSKRQYMDLSSLHVSQDLRGHGVGRVLFETAKSFARDSGAKKLYISAHSSVESQAFYRAMQCKEAEEYDAVHTNREPCDCQLECLLD